ncbi:MAG: transposase, partial [Thermodesulfovibrionales bacterium]
MFIRETYKKVNGKKKYRYLTIVESIRTPKGPTNRTVLNLGKVDLPRQKWPILIEMIERRLAGQRSILPEPEELQGLADSVYERILRKGRLKAKR